MEASKNTSCACSNQNSLKKSLTKGGQKMSVFNSFSVVLLFLFPKCPLCWAAYASVFSFIGFDTISYNSNWRYLILGVFLIGSFYLLRKHYMNKAWFSILFYSVSFALLLITYAMNYSKPWLLYVVLFLILLSNFSIRNNYIFLKLFKK